MNPQDRTQEAARQGGQPAVVLLNFGGPRNPEEVPGFLFEILRDPNTLQLPFPQWLQDRFARRIARRRSPEIQRQYGEIGGASPIVAATDRLAVALREALAEAGAPPAVYVVHRNLAGWADRTASELVAAGVDAILALPLYPQFSFATSGSAFQQLGEALRRAGYRGEIAAVRDYPDAPGYLDALAHRLQACLDAGNLKPAETVILCSAHGLPSAYVERGDPYRLELYRTLAALRARFPAWRFVLSFQSRVGPMEWLRPYTDEIIPELAEAGARHLVFLPVSFVNDHIETLFEIGHTYFDLARRHGLTPHLVRAVEDHPAFVAMLRDAVLAWRKGHGGVPMAELLPPDRSFVRTGAWAWGLWLAALFTALLFALTAG